MLFDRIDELGGTLASGASEAVIRMRYIPRFDCQKEVWRS